MTTRKLNIS